jgi:hypothetical protein
LAEVRNGPVSAFTQTRSARRIWEYRQIICRTQALRLADARGFQLTTGAIAAYVPFRVQIARKEPISTVRFVTAYRTPAEVTLVATPVAAVILLQLHTSENALTTFGYISCPTTVVSRGIMTIASRTPVVTTLIEHFGKSN